MTHRFNDPSPCILYAKGASYGCLRIRSREHRWPMLGTIVDKKAGFRSLRDTWADTTMAQGRLMLTVFGGLAEFERELIRARTGEKRERAKARGDILGRKPKLTVHQRREAIARREGERC